MKKLTVLLLSLLMILNLTACGRKEDGNGTSDSRSSVGNTTSESQDLAADVPKSEVSGENSPVIPENTEGTGSRVLIAYFSVPEDVETTDAVAGASIVVKDNEKMGNTEYVAGLIQQTVGGDLFRIEAVEEYPLDHDPLVDQAAVEQDENKRPELKNHIEGFEQYETVILGFPNWWADLPMPVYTFLEEYDFGAKTIIPFVTHGGSGFSGTLQTISKLQPGAHVSDNTLSLSRNAVADSEEDVIAWAEGLSLNTVEPVPQSSGDTVADATADAGEQQILYLWEDGNMPAVTQYTQNNGNYADDPDFCPYMVTFPVPEGTEVKGAVLINAGGAFQFRSDQNEGTPVAEELSRLGYQSFVVNYRLRPYTQEEGALDLARAVRFVRKHAEVYGIDEKDIAVMGFSAGGILAGEMLLNFDGTVNGTALDPNYIPDELDDVSADAGADGMIYSFYGRLSVASTDVDKFAASDLPPTYFCYGTRDPFVGEFEECVEALEEAGVSVKVNVLDGRPHGYGYMEGWIPDYDEWLTGIFENN
ncbi:MAG: flavodoxin [Lachnospiraceae bacterium]|nr:flavodoxin [Lachnospiraceae bacterium]